MNFHISFRKQEISIAFLLFVFGVFLLFLKASEFYVIYNYREYLKTHGSAGFDVKQNIIKVIPELIVGFLLVFSSVFLFFQKRIGWILGNSISLFILVYPIFIIIRKIIDNKDFNFFQTNKEKWFMSLYVFLLLLLLFFLNKQVSRLNYQIITKHYLIAIVIFLSLFITFLLN